MLFPVIQIRSYKLRARTRPVSVINVLILACVLLLNLINLEGAFGLRVSRKCPLGHYYSDGCVSCWCDPGTGQKVCENMIRCPRKKVKCPMGRTYQDECSNDCTCYESTGAIFCKEKGTCNTIRRRQTWTSNRPYFEDFLDEENHDHKLHNIQIHTDYELHLHKNSPKSQKYPKNSKNSPKFGNQRPLGRIGSIENFENFGSFENLEKSRISEKFHNFPNSVEIPSSIPIPKEDLIIEPALIIRRKSFKQSEGLGNDLKNKKHPTTLLYLYEKQLKSMNEFKNYYKHYLQNQNQQNLHSTELSEPNSASSEHFSPINAPNSVKQSNSDPILLNLKDLKHHQSQYQHQRLELEHNLKTLNSRPFTIASSSSRPPQDFHWIFKNIKEGGYISPASTSSPRPQPQMLGPIILNSRPTPRPKSFMEIAVEEYEKALKEQTTTKSPLSWAWTSISTGRPSPSPSPTYYTSASTTTSTTTTPKPLNINKNRWAVTSFTIRTPSDHNLHNSHSTPRPFLNLQAIYSPNNTSILMSSSTPKSVRLNPAYVTSYTVSTTPRPTPTPQTPTPTPYPMYSPSYYSASSSTPSPIYYSPTYGPSSTPASSYQYHSQSQSHPYQSPLGPMVHNELNKPIFVNHILATKKYPEIYSTPNPIQDHHQHHRHHKGQGHQGHQGQLDRNFYLAPPPPLPHRPKQFRLFLKNSDTKPHFYSDRNRVPLFVDKIAKEYFRKPAIFIPKIKKVDGRDKLELKEVVYNHKEMIPKELVMEPGGPPMKIKFTEEAERDMDREWWDAVKGVKKENSLGHQGHNYHHRDPPISPGHYDYPSGQFGHHEVQHEASYPGQKPLPTYPTQSYPGQKPLSTYPTKSYPGIHPMENYPQQSPQEYYPDQYHSPAHAPISPDFSQSVPPQPQPEVHHIQPFQPEARPPPLQKNDQMIFTNPPNPYDPFEYSNSKYDSNIGYEPPYDPQPTPYAPPVHQSQGQGSTIAPNGMIVIDHDHGEIQAPIYPHNSANPSYPYNPTMPSVTNPNSDYIPVSPRPNSPSFQVPTELMDDFALGSSPSYSSYPNFGVGLQQESFHSQDGNVMLIDSITKSHEISQSPHEPPQFPYNFNYNPSIPQNPPQPHPTNIQEILQLQGLQLDHKQGPKPKPNHIHIKSDLSMSSTTSSPIYTTSTPIYRSISTTTTSSPVQNIQFHDPFAPQTGSSVTSGSGEIDHDKILREILSLDPDIGPDAVLIKEDGQTIPPLVESTTSGPQLPLIKIKGDSGIIPPHLQQYTNDQLVSTSTLAPSSSTTELSFDQFYQNLFRQHDQNKREDKKKPDALVDVEGLAKIFQYDSILKNFQSGTDEAEAEANGRSFDKREGDGKSKDKVPTTTTTTKSISSKESTTMRALELEERKSSNETESVIKNEGEDPSSSFKRELDWKSGLMGDICSTNPNSALCFTYKSLCMLMGS